MHVLCKIQQYLYNALFVRLDLYVMVKDLVFIVCEMWEVDMFMRGLLLIM